MAGIHTLCKLTKTIVGSSHIQARSLNHRFFDSLKFSAIGRRKRARAMTVPPTVPHVARAVLTFVIVDRSTLNVER